MKIKSFAEATMSVSRYIFITFTTHCIQAKNDNQPSKHYFEDIGSHQLGTVKGDSTKDIYIVRSTNASTTTIVNIQSAKNDALRIITGS